MFQWKLNVQLNFSPLLICMQTHKNHSYPFAQSWVASYLVNKPTGSDSFIVVTDEHTLDLSQRRGRNDESVLSGEPIKQRVTRGVKLKETKTKVKKSQTIALAGQATNRIPYPLKTVVLVAKQLDWKEHALKSQWKICSWNALSSSYISGDSTNNFLCSSWCVHSIMCTCARTTQPHTRTHARMHARTHTHTYTRTHAHTHARTHTRTHTHTTHKCTHVCAHAYTSPVSQAKIVSWTWSFAERSTLFAWHDQLRIGYCDHWNFCTRKNFVLLHLRTFVPRKFPYSGDRLSQIPINLYSCIVFVCY